MPVTADAILRSDYRGLAAWLTAVGSAAAASTSATPLDKGGLAPMAEDAAAGASAADPAAAGAAAGSVSGGQGNEIEGSERAAVRERIMTKIMDELIFHPRMEVCACAASSHRQITLRCSTAVSPDALRRASCKRD